MLISIVKTAAVVACLALGVAPAVRAASPPTNLSDKNTEVKLTFDRASAVGNLNVYWRAVAAVKPGYYTSAQGGYTQVHFLCLSETDSTSGACPTSSQGSGRYGSTPITLKFTERRSRISVDLIATGTITRIFSETGNPACDSFVTSTSWALNGAGATYCDAPGRPYINGTSINVVLPSAQLKRIPTGGEWSAQLVLNGKPWASSPPTVKWVAYIDLTVTDKGNIQAFLPQFPTGKARVDLNLRAQPLPAAGSRVTGLATIDLCLYDGYNSNSSSFQLTFKDALPRGGRLPEQFSVVRKADPLSPAPDQNNPSDRIDYTVEMSGPALGSGKPGVRPLVNGETFTMTSIGDANIRAVRIPQVITPVVCTPTPLTLTAVPFNQLDKRAGHYEGTLSVVFTPSSESL
ncbi:CfaE/CblD family pilus tip adhesin [Stenotrophomonas sp. NA06056]|uniref:CfaE/CblD family pilus tip adhesin n=1 Tax=Stenotrophomonas sp. NA06056 TaxID=2742129 RepID=UPI00158C9031|nr:CfaE/CblD family pilus tip adhesin [Stenotrophomonas sp. NA06056]QKW55407.1 hypothetical protein HUT07_01850 [Stenotrophomonas sp. NA06056]